MFRATAVPSRTVPIPPSRTPERANCDDPGVVASRTRRPTPLASGPRREGGRYGPGRPVRFPIVGRNGAEQFALQSYGCKGDRGRRYRWDCPTMRDGHRPRRVLSGTVPRCDLQPRERSGSGPVGTRGVLSKHPTPPGPPGGRGRDRAGTLDRQRELHAYSCKAAPSPHTGRRPRREDLIERTTRGHAPDTSTGITSEQVAGTTSYPGSLRPPPARKKRLAGAGSFAGHGRACRA